MAPARPLSINLFVFYVGQSMQGQPLACFVQGQRTQRSIRSHWGCGARINPHSAVRANCEQTYGRGVLVKHENFSIIDSAKNLASLRILESLYIHKLGPELRGSSQNFGIFFIIGPILLKFSHNM